MSYSLNININEEVKNFAPDLTEEEVNSIAESIFKEYDYSKIYDTIESYVIQFAEDNDLTYEVEELEELNEIDQPEYKWTMTDSSNKVITIKANPNATNSELEAKIVVKNDKEKDEEKEQYDKIPKRY